MSLLANAWDDRGHDVSVVTFEAVGVASAYPLSGGVTQVQLDLSATSDSLGSAVWNNWHRIRCLRQCLQSLKPDVVVAFMTEMNVLALCAGMDAAWPTVISERIHPAHHRVAWPWAQLRRWLYPRAAAVIAQTEGIASWLRRHTGASTQVIANPVDLSAFANGVAVGDRGGERKRLLGVGRLDPQKGFAILIDAFANVAAQVPEWDLAIFGEGSLGASLREQINQRKMEGRITLHGSSRDIAAVYGSANAFVHSARYEGYPNVVIEALASGLPVIAVDSPGAIRTLLGRGKHGVLVSLDSGALADALVATLSNPEKLAALAHHAREAVKNNDVNVISQEWLELFQSVIAK